MEKTTPEKNKIRNGLREIWQKIKCWLDIVLLQKDIQQGAAWVVGISIVLASSVIGSDIRSGIGTWVDIFVSALLAGLGFFLFQLISTWCFSIINRSLARPAAIFIAGWVFWINLTNLKDYLVFWPMALLVVVEMILGGSLSYIKSRAWKEAGIVSKAWAPLAVFSTLVLNSLFIFWLFNPGTDTHLLEFEPYQGNPQIQTSSPIELGPYKVLTLSYGSGTDQRREEYGDQVDLLSKTVNASSFVYNPNPNLQDFKDWFFNMAEEEFPLEDWIESKLRYWYWGFDRTAYPLNAQVWYPEGDGIFPLVLMVHGNHDMVDFSEFGYAYLGELLASRGYIFVSVDENFLNGYFAGGISGENDARGWLLLKHLELWEDWQVVSDNPFAGKVDLNNIALIGHSRGGEAVSVAAAFNKLDRYPDNGKIKLDFQFNIRSVIAIAPVDQQYQPADRPLPLSDINYLVLQGAHDADVSSFTGLRQYQRVTFSDPSSDLFKAALYIYQANHSQFNSDWGSYDLSLPRAFYLNTKPLLSPEQQQQIASVYISAFLDATLKGEKAYRPIFEDYHNAGIWLPPTLYINQFQSAAYQPIARFEEDIELTTLSVSGGRLEINGLTRWQEVALEFRTGKEQDNQVVELTWSSFGGSFQLILPNNFSEENEIDGDSTLVFNLADDRFQPEDLLDISIAIVDDRGRVASLPLSTFAPILPSFIVQFSKYESWEVDKYENPTETILQSYQIPLSAFLAVQPDIDLERIGQIRFILDQTTNGRLFLDEIGFEK